MSARRIAAQARMELRLLLRNGENLLVTLAIPAALLVFFVTVEVVDLPQPAVDFVYPGVLAVAVMATGMVSLAIATGFERSYLVLKRLGATPLLRGELVAAKIIAVLAVEMVQVVVLTAVALALGWRLPSAAPVSDVVPALLLGTGAFAGLGMAMAGRLRAVVTLAVANGLFVTLLLLSGVIVPLTALPPPLAAAAAFSPAGALAAVLRHALGGAPIADSALSVLTFWALVAPLVAGRIFRWEEAP